MKIGASAAGSAQRAARFYRAFRRLSAGHRRDLALRILHDENLMADLYDHVLIRKAMEANGRSVSWDSYLARKRR